MARPTPPPIFAHPPRRILIIKPSAIGDVVHALPVLNLLRRRWPAAHISWMITPACAGLLEGHRQIDQLIRFDRKTFGRGWRSPQTVGQIIEFRRQLGGENFDLVIDLQGLFRSGVMSSWTGAPVRVGSTAAREFGWLFYTHVAPVLTWNQHAIERYLIVAEFLGLGRSPVEFVFATDDADRAHVDHLLPAGKPIAVLLPAANWATKRWPIEKFAALVEPLQKRFGLQAVLAGGPDAAAMAASLPGAINLAGQTTLRQLTALLERAALVIANDTGPMHIAAALGRPLVTMFGPTDPVQTGPYARPETVLRLDIPCSPCYARRCSHISCLQWLNVEAVLGRAEVELNAECKMQNAK
jgi:heptosyltransferase-1